jgi:DNA-binding CsgD family transcriptional regulator/GAF domain-containing protein
MAHTSGGVDGSAEERVRVVLDGLRTVAKPDDRTAVMGTSDAQAILDDAWCMLAQLLAEGSTPDAGEVLDMLRRLSQVDHLLLRSQTANRIGEVLTRLETAQCSVRGLVEMAPGLIGELGFDRAIISRIDEGVWIPELVFVANDPQWAEVINRVGQEHPQPLTPRLMETELVRRRQGVMVYDVQHSSRVNRAITEESRSRSYVAAPIMSGNRVIGILHGDRYLRGRDIDAADLELLLSFAHGLQLALSRAAVVEQLQSMGDALKGATSGLSSALVGAHNVSLGSTQLGEAHVVDSSESARTALPASSQATRSVRDLLTDREFEVLELVALGRTNAAIASRLFISEGTVKQHVKHILRKLKVGNRAEAVSRLYQSTD